MLQQVVFGVVNVGSAEDIHRPKDNTRDECRRRFIDFNRMLKGNGGVAEHKEGNHQGVHGEGVNSAANLGANG